MQKSKKTKILHLKLPLDARLLFMSDLHGDVRLFKEALQKAKFCAKDYLFVIGDMIEKGDFLDNLAMLDFILELNQQKNVFFMAGNCDEIFRFILPPLDEERFLYYGLELKKSILNDLSYVMNYPITKTMNVLEFVNEVKEKYPQYFDFIDDLPDVIFIQEDLVLVHGGIKDIYHVPENAIEVLKYDYFLEESPIQPRLMIVGHNPTRNYSKTIASVNPIFSWEKNIISIDGGNNVVKGGQLNVLILDNLKNKNFSYFALDHYPKYIMEEEVEPMTFHTDCSLNFGKTEVTLLQRDLDFCLVQPKGTKDELWVHEEFLYRNKDRLYCTEGVNSFLNLHKGDKISVIKRAKPYSLVKCKGQIGLLKSEYIHDTQISD